MARILVVEDDEIFPEILCDMLSNLGHEAVCVSDGVEAMRIIIEIDKHFDLILTDLGMSNMGGIELIERIKKVETIPVILMTGSNISEEVLASGAIGFLSKPFDSKQLHEAIVDAILEI